MSCLHNEMILESLFEKYLEEGHSEEVAEEKAMEEFELWDPKKPKVLIFPS